ncbi:CDP-diacylglycerol--glycerol-3-phosphate 3-phosphatidyltransferase [Sanguibacter gelidistatuariae]|uniref:CDP-diacylglycerol--glycerol-3-phosphate 3-phosphatidyltransferase n=1 Tax=Sanguibacter gelidistatuariae TaxID=1814289 RepID=A0A1G6XET9_9MICO|nr:CDP-alcohol phosphatidyltransferase family protein [Sanguibacter gelidistatuariae]SDD76582.1 CDP-diacylglycerol--glycerol-3-phosphate 3-phosphatidyltransferase [Sanguibacter gelidistatuariae]
MRGLYALKPWYTRRLTSIIRVAVARGLSPDVFTAVGAVSALGAGVAIAYGNWILALVLLAGRLAGANLDGAVARARGVSRPWGFVLNELGDRAGDLAMFAGLVVLAERTLDLGWGTGWATGWVLIAAVCATLPTFTSLSGAGAGAPRLNGGPFGKTERCAVVVVATAVPAWIPAVSALIVVGSVVTMLVRLRTIHRLLDAPAPVAHPAGDR